VKSHQRPKSRPTAAQVASLRELVARFKINTSAASTAKPAAAGAVSQKARRPHRAASTVTKGDSPEAQIPLDGRDEGFNSF
jgi:hypothetical protein